MSDTSCTHPPKDTETHRQIKTQTNAHTHVHTQTYIYLWVLGEMDQWLGAFVALAEDPGSIPSTHMAAHNCP